MKGFPISTGDGLVPDEFRDLNYLCYLVEGNRKSRQELCGSVGQTILKKIVENRNVGRIAEIRDVVCISSVKFLETYQSDWDGRLEFGHRIRETYFLWVNLGMEYSCAALSIFMDMLFSRFDRKLVTVLSVSDFEKWLDGISFLGENVLMDITGLIEYRYKA